MMVIGLICCSVPVKVESSDSGLGHANDLSLASSNTELVKAFDWAKRKALSFVHDGTDPVGFWYEAALPNREAFCMRDVAHQSLGAEILGLGKHNYNMILKFAQNISEEKDYCTYWEINRHNKPAPVDYENDRDFWYNLPANFDIINAAFRLYKWTGNQAFLEDPDLSKFYVWSLNQYIDRWDLSADEVQQRKRSMHLSDVTSRFGDKRGIPTYNEGGRGTTILGIDLTASIIAAYKAYAGMLQFRGEITEASKYSTRAQKEIAFLNDYWWDPEKDAYRSIIYEDGTCDYFMVGENQAFLHYLLYFDALSDPTKIRNIVDNYVAAYDKLIVELKSYLPIIFYEHNEVDLANRMIVDLCSSENKRRDYPENSFTIIEHVTRGWMGVNVDAATNSFSTLSRMDTNKEWAELKNIRLLSNRVTVRHQGKHHTEAMNMEGPSIKWRARMSGRHEFLIVNGQQVKSLHDTIHGHPNSYVLVDLKKGEKAIVSLP